MPNIILVAFFACPESDCHYLSALNIPKYILTCGHSYTLGNLHEHLAKFVSLLTESKTTYFPSRKYGN